MLWVGEVLAMYIYERRWNWAMMKSQLTSTRTPSLFLRLFLSLSISPFSLPSVIFAQCTNTSNVHMYVRKVSQVGIDKRVVDSSCPAKHLAPRRASARSRLQTLPYLICKL